MKTISTNARKGLVLLLALVMVMAMSVSAFAAETEVKIETKATTVNVTVPATGIPIVFNEDGTNTYPTNWAITNNSAIAGLHLSKIDMTGTDGWSLLGESADTKVLAADTKQIKFSMGKSGSEKLVDPSAGATFTPSEISIPASESQVFSFVVERAAFTQSAASTKAFDMTLTFDFN